MNFYIGYPVNYYFSFRKMKLQKKRKINDSTPSHSTELLSMKFKGCCNKDKLIDLQSHPAGRICKATKKTKRANKTRNAKVLENQLREYKESLHTSHQKNSSLTSVNRELRQRMRDTKKEMQEEKRTYKRFEKHVSSLMRRSQEESLILASTIKQLQNRLSTLEQAEQEKLRVRDEQRRVLELKDEIIQNLSFELESINQGKCKKPVQLVDLPEEVLGLIFAYIPNDEILWTLGQTCQKMMEYVLRHIWVIEDSVSKPMIGSIKENIIDLTSHEKVYVSRARAKVFQCQIPKAISTDAMGKDIYHFAHICRDDDTRKILRQLKDMNNGDRSKKVLLVKTPKMNYIDILISITSQWKQLESIILCRENGLQESAERIRYILLNSLNLKFLNLSGGENSVCLSIEGWNYVSDLCSNLTHISFQGCTITDENIDRLTRNNQRLWSIELDRCKMTTDKALHHIFQNSITLKSLKVHMWEITGEAFEHAPKCTDLKCLAINMTGYVKRQQKRMTIFQYMPGFVKHLNLEDLEFIGLYLREDPTAHKFLKICSNLTTLKLKESSLHNNWYAQIKRLSTLKNLDLSGVSVSANTVKEICRGCKVLEALKITPSDNMTSKELQNVYEIFPKISRNVI